MPTLILQPDAAAGKDTYLNVGGGGNYDYGTKPLMRVGRVNAGDIQRGLLEFSLSLPSGAVVSSAILTLECVEEEAVTDYSIYVRRGLISWIEGPNNDAIPAPGQDASVWAFRNYNGAVPWAGGAGGGSGLDYSAAVTAATTITGLGTFTWDVTADVAAWAAGTSNFGFWLFGEEAIDASRKCFAPSDYGVAASRPKLVIDYVLPAGGVYVPLWLCNPSIPRGRW